MAILFVLKGAATDIYRRLMDAVEPELVEAAEISITATPGVLGIERLRLRWTGHRIRAEAAVLVDPVIGVVEGHAIAVDVHHRLLHDIPRLIDATVHVSPLDPGEQDHHAALAHHRGSAPIAGTTST